MTLPLKIALRQLTMRLFVIFNFFPTKLGNLVDWSLYWKMSLNQFKCLSMHFGIENRCHDYTMDGQKLAKTSKERDLGIIITSDLKSGEQLKEFRLETDLAIR
ncbi:RNA-directed DNA polymerase from mobile element jockey-like [Brachionus plicatilis]|uniref:RNA-directed DNA polymerase from mobile element jockey-like n=1 Tax=Brachionus plicatilis TaxID=10195 RepID=A0A3M7PQ55_BRAPC|nr:RNA-directed DNA polymerase from mobile element jockey-like [Brachionus plicatilis]